MAIKLTSRTMAGGNGHEHISQLGWVQDGTDNKGVSSRDDIVTFIDKNGNQSVYCPDQKGGPSAWVHVNSNGYVRYPQTKADNRWTNNLLALPLMR